MAEQQLHGPPGRPWGVLAEMIEGGGPQVLRWYPTRRAAEDHPVKRALWKRVWVEKRPAPEPPCVPKGTPPWTIEEPAGSRFTYIRDAGDSRVASLLGSKADRRRVTEVLRAAGVIRP